ncbi:MAG: lytic transglycosylase domain-containing protein [Pseudomonadota bacterium]
MRVLIKLIVFLLLPFWVSATEFFPQASKAQLNLFNKLWQQVEAGEAVNAEQLTRLDSNVSQKLIMWKLLQGDYGDFRQITDFIAKSHHWPEINKLRSNAEQSILLEHSNKEVFNWFESYPPISTEGKKIYYTRQLDSCLVGNNNHIAQCKKYVRQMWHELTFSVAEEQYFLTNYGELLNNNDYLRRIKMFTRSSNWPQVKRLYPRLSSGWRELYKICYELGAKKRFNHKLYQQLKPKYKGQPDLVYLLLKQYTNHNELGEFQHNLVKILTKPLPNPEHWWRYRHIVVRDLMQLQDFENAYLIAANHGLTRGTDCADAEWIAGWLALRFLNQPDIAKQHFNNLAQNTTAGMSQSRAYYWLAMADMDLKQPQSAMVNFKKAAQYPDLFYGQLAYIKLGKNVPQRNTKSSYTKSDMAYLQKSTLAEAAWWLLQIDQDQDAREFLKLFVMRANTRGQKYLAAKMADEFKQTHLAVTVAKLAAKHGEVFAEYSHPTIKLKKQHDDVTSLVHSLIRQESNFQTAAISPAGARGLMQLMPKTAKRTAKAMKMRFYKRKLTKDRNYNLKIGIAHLRELLDYFDGSYVLAVSAYNAGATATERWMKLFGDPRELNDLDEVVDWVESITYGETRNYVQRVLENLQVYHYIHQRPSNKYKVTQLVKDLGVHKNYSVAVMGEVAE